MRIVRRLAPFVPAGAGRWIDVGCGTGHNAETFRDVRQQIEWVETDVVDMKVVGPAPVIVAGDALPFVDGSFDGALLLFVLHYPPDPVSLLREVRRVTAGRALVLQSTYDGKIAGSLLRIREFFQGRGALAVARWAGLVPRTAVHPLRPRRYMTRPELEGLFRESGWRVARRRAEGWRGVRLSRDLYVLERAGGGE